MCIKSHFICYLRGVRDSEMPIYRRDLNEYFESIMKRFQVVPCNFPEESSDSLRCKS